MSTIIENMEKKNAYLHIPITPSFEKEIEEICKKANCQKTKFVRGAVRNAIEEIKRELENKKNAKSIKVKKS